MEKKYIPIHPEDHDRIIKGQTDGLSLEMALYNAGFQRGIGATELNPDLLKVMQDAETTKEDDLKKVKEEVNDGYPKTPEMDLILRIVANWGNAIEMPNMEGWVKEHAGAVRIPVTIAIFEFIRDCAENWDHDTDGHRYNTGCRMCDAKEFYEDLKKKKEQFTPLITGEEQDDWISVDDQLPIEGGRYWCYVMHQGDLGVSYFQWNCDYNDQLKRFSDMTLTRGEVVTHWRNLPDPPKRKEVPNG